MNLLTDPWIPVRPQAKASAQKLTLRQLLCEDKKWELCLPRDDMEMAALQLLICMVQSIFSPANFQDLKKCIMAPMGAQRFEVGCKAVEGWFQLDHSEYPFMQRKGAKVETPMDKLLAGLTGAQNCCFVNEPNLAARLCAGCTAIALFNLATCSPSFGGGFKLGLRQGAAVTTLLKGEGLRQTIWLNIISADKLDQFIPWYSKTINQPPTWVEPINSGKIPVNKIGLLRGLFWQPAFIEMKDHDGAGKCSCCGLDSEVNYTHFFKDKFSSFDVDGTWPHLHSPISTSVNRGGDVESTILSFGKSTAPAWTNLARFVVQQRAEQNLPGQKPAAVVLHAMSFLNKSKIELVVGGYENQKGQASILGRKHEVFLFNPGWGENASVINELVKMATDHRDALGKAMWVLAKKIVSNKSNRTKWLNGVERQFYRRSEDMVLDSLTRIDFEQPTPTLRNMRQKLQVVVHNIFDESIQPYRNNPELIRVIAIARKTLHKHLNALKTQEEG